MSRETADDPPRCDGCGSRLDDYKRFGALAQAARNYIHTRTQYDLLILDRLAAEAAEKDRILAPVPWLAG